MRISILTLSSSSHDTRAKTLVSNQKGTPKVRSNQTNKIEPKLTMNQLKDFVDVTTNLSLNESFTVIESNNSVSLNLDFPNQKSRLIGSLVNPLSEDRTARSLSSLNSDSYFSALTTSINPRASSKSFFLIVILMIIALVLFSALQFYFLRWLKCSN